MRTTIDIDDDILAAAKDLAKMEGRTMSDVISELARRGLTAPSFEQRQMGAGSGFAEPAVAFDYGDWPSFPQRSAAPVTSALIERIQDELDREDATAFDHASNRPV